MVPIDLGNWVLPGPGRLCRDPATGRVWSRTCSRGAFVLRVRGCAIADAHRGEPGTGGRYAGIASTLAVATSLRAVLPLPSRTGRRAGRPAGEPARRLARRAHGPGERGEGGTDPSGQRHEKGV